MFDNVAFNVVIGLVFIYLLYSLLVTLVGEMLSNWFGLRPRMLRVAIERMLNDGYYYRPRNQNRWTRFRTRLSPNLRKTVSTQNRMASFFLIASPGFKSSFAGFFYRYPSIKYLAQLESDQKGLFGQTKPSYITADTFANTLINILTD